MNVLYIHTHDSGRYLEPYDPGIRTPALLRLAKEGTLFRNMYCCGPTCSPSRAALLTGQFPHQNGMLGLAHRGFALADYDKHLANYLRRHQYETVLCGMQHVAANPHTIGYDRVYIDSRKEAEDLTAWDTSNGDSAIAYLREKHTKPFFLSYGLVHTHRPFHEIDDSVDPNYLKVPPSLPDNAETRRDYAGYLTSAIRADACIERVLKTLREEGLEEDTLILYTTDHGIAFPHMKCTLYDSGIGVACIIKYPGNPSRGQAKDALTSHIDVFPTLCDLLGLPQPDWLEGQSLLPLLENSAAEVNEAIYAETTYHAAYEPQRCIRTQRYKYIRRYDDYDDYVPANIDNGYSKDFLLDHGLLGQKRATEELFDLVFDPNERNNVADDASYSSIKLQLVEPLAQRLEETDDFLGRRPVPRPANFILNKRTCVDPDSQDSSDYEVFAD